MGKKIKNKKGVASFYIVAFSTLILIVIATSFAAVIISEMERTANDDLSQSAYDSALAGVEDAKLAVYSYQECAKNPGSEECAGIVSLVENPENHNCDQVAKILGRYQEEDGGVPIQEETNGDNSMQQAYTCVMISGITDNYKATLTNSNQSKIIRPKFDTDGDKTGAIVHASNIKKIKISWYSGNNKNTNGGGLNYNNFDKGSNVVTFPSVGTEGSITDTPTPPIIAVGLIQAPSSFKLSDFERTVGESTNRGLIYLVPTNDKNTIGKTTGSDGKEINYVGSAEGNYINNSAFLKSNDKSKTNKPYTVVCDETGDYVCSAIIEIPDTINGFRDDENFAIIASLPYGRPDTDIMVEFLCGDENVCSKDGDVNSSTAKLEWVQIEVDSTGRANDLYRRVETRLEGDSTSIISGMNAIEIVGDINKNIFTTCEYDFNPTCFE